MKNKIKTIAERAMLRLLAPGLLLAASCGKEPEPGSVQPPPERRHTVLAYLGRDNSLSGSAEEKIAPMLEGWNPRQGDLVIYEDMAGRSPRLYEACRDGGANSVRIVSEYEEQNSAGTEVLGRVVDEVKRRYPADSYGLILFSHASGWLPPATLDSPRSRSVIVDGSDEMELADFAAALPDGLFDYIVFEACFMAGIEVAYGLRDKARYILASSAEILSPGFREAYRSSLGDLPDGEEGLVRFARRAFEWADGQSGAYRSSTLTVIRTSGLAALGRFLRENAGPGTGIGTADIQHFDRYGDRLFFDFEDYFSRRLATETLRQQLSTRIGDCLAYRAATPSFMAGFGGFDIRRHSGLTTYIEQREFPFLNAEYRKTDWYRDVLEGI